MGYKKADEVLVQFGSINICAAACFFRAYIVNHLHRTENERKGKNGRVYGRVVSWEELTYGVRGDAVVVGDGGKRHILVI